MTLIGAHVLIEGPILKRLEYLKQINGNVLQIYLGNPRSWKQKANIHQDDATKIRKYLGNHNIQLFVHLRLNINICTKDISMTKAIVDEFETIDKISALGGVIHLGKATSQDLKTAIMTSIDNLNYIKTKISTPEKLIIETSSGQGTETGVKLEDFAFILENVKDASVCVDTAHIFAAGYDIRTSKGVKEYFSKFDKLIGINRIKLIHLNDSKKHLDSRVDRHEILRKGFIFEDEISGLEEICNFARTHSIPLVLETKSDNHIENGFMQEIMMVRSIWGELESQEALDDFDEIPEVSSHSKNLILSELLFEIAKYEKAENLFKAKAYETVAIEIKNYDKKIKDVEKLKTEISGIGKSIQTDIEQFLKDGKIEKLEMFRSNPDNDFVSDFEKIDGFGPKFSKKLVEELNINTIEELREKIKKDEITLNHAQILGLKYYEDSSEKIPRKEIDKVDEILKDKIDYEITGSYRRGALKSGDIDILTTNDIDDVLEILKKYIVDEISKGEKKYMGYIKVKKIVRRIDIRSVDEEDWAPALMYFTGSKEFNIKMRKYANSIGYKLNEYGLFKGEKKLKLKSEEEIFHKLKMEYFTPEERDY